MSNSATIESLYCTVIPRKRKGCITIVYGTHISKSHLRLIKKKHPDQVAIPICFFYVNSETPNSRFITVRLIFRSIYYVGPAVRVYNFTDNWYWIRWFRMKKWNGFVHFGISIRYNSLLREYINNDHIIEVPTREKKTVSTLVGLRIMISNIYCNSGPQIKFRLSVFCIEQCSVTNRYRCPIVQCTRVITRVEKSESKIDFVLITS